MIGRNEPCTCGSGLKYKKCCLKIDRVSEADVRGQLKMPIHQILPLIKTSIASMHILGGCTEEVRVLDVSLLNSDVLQIDFKPYSRNSQDIKGEIASIVSFLYGLFKDDAFEHANFIRYAVRGYDEQGEELISSISTADSARMLGNGNSLDWYKSTLFIENTPDYRLGIAKRLISEIENGLRHAITNILSLKYGHEWWGKCLNNKSGDSVKETYKHQFGYSTNDGSILINYTYTLGLKKIITTCWTDFKNLFESKRGFEDDMEALNNIRKEEAHNRAISAKHITDLDRLHWSLLERISIDFPEVLSVYLVENWRLKIKEIMMDPFQASNHKEEFEKQVDPILKLQQIKIGIEDLIKYLCDTEKKLDSIVVPTQKKSIHERLINKFRTFKELHQLQIEAIKSGSVEGIESSIDKINFYKSEMESFAAEFIISES